MDGGRYGVSVFCDFVLIIKSHLVPFEWWSVVDGVHLQSTGSVGVAGTGVPAAPRHIFMKCECMNCVKNV